MKKVLRKELLYLRDNIEDRYDKSMIIKDKVMNLKNDLEEEAKEQFGEG